MKITAKEKPESKNEFPKLMISTVAGHIVYVTEPGRGILLRCTIVSHRHCPSYQDTLNMEFFEDFHGEITLSND